MNPIQINSSVEEVSNMPSACPFHSLGTAMINEIVPPVLNITRYGILKMSRIANVVPCVRSEFPNRTWDIILIDKNTRVLENAKIGWVYFIVVGLRIIKVGSAENINNRLYGFEQSRSLADKKHSTDTNVKREFESDLASGKVVSVYAFQSDSYRAVERSVLAVMSAAGYLPAGNRNRN